VNPPPALLAFLDRQWRHGGWLSALLVPFSVLTAWAVRRKRAAYRDGRRPAYRAPVPVVVVGNVYVGGTGKTPVVIAAVRGLRTRGWTPGVISRGYGAAVGDAPRVGRGAALAAAEFGDEPALVARATGAPVAVHPHRALAAQALLRAHPEVDVIVSDDGLQHLALARDVEIVVQDERGMGNGRLLPAGPLREPASRLDEVDAIVTNTSRPAPDEDVAPPADLAAAPSPTAPPACLAPSSVAPADHAPPVRPLQLRMWLQPEAARRLADGAERPLAWFAQPQAGRVAAAAGIGNPRRFFRTLRAAGIAPTQELALPDHYAYTQSPFGMLQADHILVTAKDAVKCAALGDPRLWEVGVAARFSAPGLDDWLAGALAARGHGRRA